LCGYQKGEQVNHMTFKSTHFSRTSEGWHRRILSSRPAWATQWYLISKHTHMHTHIHTHILYNSKYLIMGFYSQHVVEKEIEAKTHGKPHITCHRKWGSVPPLAICASPHPSLSLTSGPGVRGGEGRTIKTKGTWDHFIMPDKTLALHLKSSWKTQKWEFFSFCSFLFCFLRKSLPVAQTALPIMLLLPPPPRHWECKCAPLVQKWEFLQKVCTKNYDTACSRWNA
jgi:hypothetical protein